MAQQVSVRHKSSHIANVGGDSAFTLIELLVVIVIVGIVSAVALLSFGILGDDRNLQREARRMGSLIELHRAMARNHWRRNTTTAPA